MQKIIEFEDKVALYHNSNIPDINKVNDTDMNEIKSVVNGSLQGTNAMGSIVVDDINCKNLFDGLLELGNYSNSTGAKFDANNIYRNTNPISVKPNTTYTFSINGVSQKYCTYYYGADGTFLSYDTSLTTGTFTTPANCYYVNFRCFGSDFTNDYATLKVQLELGETATSYTKGKKLIKEENSYVKENTTFYANDFKCINLLPNNIYSTTINGLTITRNEDGSFKINGTANAGTDLSPLINIKNITLKAGTYTHSVNKNKAGLYFSLNNVGDTMLDGSLGTIKKTFTLTEDKTYAKYVIWINNGTSFSNETYNFQLEVGSEATPYTPYKNFENEEIYSFGEVKIGTWIDGKPLYRKVFTITSLTSSNTNLVDVSGLSIDFAKISGTIITSTGAKFPINLYDSASNYSVIILSDAGYIRGRGAIGSGTLSKCIVILEYTKTTD